MVDSDKWQVVEPCIFIPGAQYVRCIAYIRNNNTGEIRAYQTDEILESGEWCPNVFNWAENNFACDCNRKLFFERASGNEPGETECGDGGYSVNLANAATEEVYYREYEEAMTDRERKEKERIERQARKMQLDAQLQYVDNLLKRPSPGDAFGFFPSPKPAKP